MLCCIGAPLSAITFAKSEPPTVLALSWGAMILTCVDIILTADVREKEDS